jgi:hypothetical protein
MQNNPPRQSSGGSSLSRMPLAFLMVVFLALQAMVMAFQTPFGVPPDEIAHLSYVSDASKSPVALPNYASGVIITDRKSTNYLTHPPLYYSTLGVVAKAFGLHPVNDHVAFRLISVLMVTIGLVFVVLTAAELNISQEATALVLLACAGIPMFGYLAGSVSNDNLLYLGVTAALYGIAVMQRQPPHRRGHAPWIVAAGLVMVFLTKATAMAFMVFFFAWWALLHGRKANPWALVKAYAVPATVFFLVVGGYYISTRLATGKLFPSPRLLYEARDIGDALTFTAYLDTYFTTMVARLPVVMSHLSVDPLNQTFKPAFYAMLALPITGWLIARFSPLLADIKPEHVRWLDAMMLAAMTTVAFHIAWGYRHYLINGQLSGFQPRYYAYLLPVIWLPFFALSRPGWFRQLIAGGFALLAVVVFWSTSPHFLSKQSESLDSRRQTVWFQAADPAATQQFSIRMRDVPTGNLDDFELDSGELQVRGWVFDSANGQPAARVWLVSGQRFLASSRLHIRRPDVAQALGKPGALLSGFHFALRGVPATAQRCEFNLYVEFLDGSLGLLPARACASNPEKSR